MMKTAYPQPDFARADWYNLNGTWGFSFAPEGEALTAPAYEGTIEVPYPWGSPLSGVDCGDNGTGYYKKTVAWNPDKERIFLCFGAVDYTCSVRVNGTVVGEHIGGYARFDCEVTAVWNRTGDNVIEVCATDNAAQNQTYGKQGYGDARGIWQTVWLEARAAAYISAFFVKTALDGMVSYEIEAVGAEDGMTVTAAFGDLCASAVIENGAAALSFAVEDPKLWTPETPYLYEGTLTLGADVVSTYFGIREIGTGVFGAHGHRYITLNGKPYYINGVLDQSFNPKGFFTLPSDEDCMEEILRLKRIGINMARIHIKAEEPLKLYYADKLGLLIMEDLPCFWGDPIPETRAQYERELVEQITRDRNHPSIFYWVVFNETWGLFTNYTKEDGTPAREYLPETAEWVVSCWEKVKSLDPTRLVEDNSPCNWDHTKTDVNTWHFYSNGYERVKEVVDSFCRGAYVGSSYNFKHGCTMEDVPCMNSECGNVWGIEGNAGDSDISWQYKYMMNEFRLHDKLCGFLFTEFHDVINEFNGYYKIDNSDKDFGYDLYGMSLRDLHAQDYLGADHPPMQTVNAGESVDIKMFGSSFTDARHGKVLDVVWQLTVSDAAWGAHPDLCDMGAYSVVWDGYGTFPAGVIRVAMPEVDGVACLTWSLMDGEETVMSNGILFDVVCAREDVLSIAPTDCTAEGFTKAFAVQEGNKQNGLGAGALTYTVKTDDIPSFAEADNVHILFEASTRAPMTHDFPEEISGAKVDLNYMLGYRCDPGANPNTFAQTDENKYPGAVEVAIDGKVIDVIALADCPADSRGALSHHYQASDRHLDEAGSYGYLCDVRIPSSLLLKLKEQDSFALTLRCVGEHGLSVFGRKSGRYAMDILVRAE